MTAGRFGNPIAPGVVILCLNKAFGSRTTGVVLSNSLPGPTPSLVAFVCLRCTSVQRIVSVKNRNSEGGFHIALLNYCVL